MARRRHTPEQIIRKVTEGQRLLAGGMNLADVCRQFDIAKSTWHRWINRYGGMTTDDAKELQQLKAENEQLKKLLAEAELDKAMLKYVAEKKLVTGRARLNHRRIIVDDLVDEFGNIKPGPRSLVILSPSS